MIEKNLLIKEEKLSLFARIVSFIKNIFIKEEKEVINVSFNNYSKNNFIGELKDNKKILEIQRNFECGLIKENDLSHLEREALIKLYNEQIETLQSNIQIYNKKLKYYEQKIILSKNNLNKA